MTIKKGSTGNLVKAWQEFLNTQDLVLLKTDGKFGINTDAITKIFQSKNGLDPDGIVGNFTFAKAGELGFIFPEIKNTKMETNQKGIDLIKEFEGLELHAYRDAVGVKTIGYGTTILPNGTPVQMGMSIDRNTAEEYLKHDLQKFENYVNELVTVELNENQFAALVSFTYNLGQGNLGKSNLLARLNSGDYNIGNEFLKWNKAGGNVLSGLTRRRQAERELFETEVE